MKKKFLLTAVAALVLSAAGGASAAGPQLSVVRQGAPAAQPLAHGAASTVLYDQTADDSGIGIVSQNFEAAFDAYDNQAADDFTVPAGKAWTVSEVDATGAYFSGSGPAASIHITFYKQKSGIPDAVVADFPALTCKEYFGSFSCKLPSSVKLKAGTYWLSVQANLDFSVGGQWAWENQTSVEGTAAMWQSPDDGFGTGCVKYTTESVCIADGQGDHMFRLLGKSK